jgi:hypothetical protein
MEAACRTLLASVPPSDITAMVEDWRYIVRTSEDPEEIACAWAMADVMEMIVRGDDPTDYLVALDRLCDEAEDWAAADIVSGAERLIESDTP